ncbi:hypothetical protein SCHPADRAFT_911489 [Schizopora paradoxa]|uniref:Cyclin N-terminal domain-containing protein n=1 Tax=Schizopora paradoxa TaxID=27342 RepID=A0A0H2R5F8_9AGAM|nr:hypothetical protein SCHPADRAFT_911489 [Schizopora paradoxa]
MQTLQQTMSHRGAGMTRTHARWHPYTRPRTSASNTPNYVHRPVPTPSFAVGSTSQHYASYLITPASSVSTISPASSFTSSPHASSSAPALKTIPSAKPPTSSKPPFVASLVEQSVKSLTEIWRPEYVPPVFCTSTQVSLADATNPPSITSNARRATLARKPTLQLPSPCSPSTQPSPPSYSGLAQATAFFGEQIGDGTIVTEKELVPIRIYVHEVLRRSRTTCSVLQSALCYIEAIRKKIPELAELEKSGKANKADFVIEDRIEVGDEALQTETSSSLSDCPTETMSTETIVPDSVQTVTQDQPSYTAQAENEGGLKKRKGPSKPLPPLPPLPSPLLCPRRAFLAALILASKFLQDRCYSNRAWAKLSGLAPREVSRCERALGEALEWRLWVGKSTVPSESNGRSPARARSESTINVGSPVTLEASHYQIPFPPLTNDGASLEIRSSAASFAPQENMRRVGFGRSQTLPDILANHYESSMGAADIPTPRLSYSPQSLVEPNLDTASTQYSAAWSPARSIGSNDSSDGSSPPNYIGASASFSSLDTKVAECMSRRCQHANNAASTHGFDMPTAAGQMQYPMPYIGAPSTLNFAPQATGIPSFGQA